MNENNRLDSFGRETGTRLEGTTAPQTATYVAAPLVVFDPVEPELFPERWEEDEYRVTMLLFGVIPFGEQTIRISKVRVDDIDGEPFYQLRDDGTGQLVSVWDHLISVREMPDGKRSIPTR